MINNLDASGFTFEIEPKAEKATLTYLNCNAIADKSMRGTIRKYVCQTAQFKTKTDGTLVAEIDWSKKSLEFANKTRGFLVFWLLHSIGYAVII